MCSTTKSQLHLTWLEVWWSLGSCQSMFHHAMRGDTLSHSIETIYDLWWSFGLTHPFHDAVSPWSLHIYHYEAMQGQGPQFPPTRKATIHIHRGRGGRGSRWVHYIGGGWGGGLPDLDHICPKNPGFPYNPIPMTWVSIDRMDGCFDQPQSIRRKSVSEFLGILRHCGNSCNCNLRFVTFKMKPNHFPHFWGRILAGLTNMEALDGDNNPLMRPWMG